MPELKWKSFATPDPEREYLALISYLPLKSFWKIPKFLIYTRAIEIQLKKSEGLIGYSLLAHPLSKKFWTLSVWEDGKALMEFVRSGAHKQVMAGLKGQMGETKFVKWKVNGSAVPPTWKEALKRLVMIKISP